MGYKVCLLTGIILLALSLYIGAHSLRFVQRSEKATGVVTGLEKDSGDGTVSYAPVFSIRTHDNHEIVYHHPFSTAPASWSVGETALFLYDPQDLSGARMYTYFGIFSWSIVLMGLSVFLITLGSGYLLLRPYCRP